MRDHQSQAGQQPSADDTQLHIEPLQAAESGGVEAGLLERMTRALQSRPDLVRKLSLGVLIALLLAIALTVWQPPIGALFAALHRTATPSGRSSVAVSLQIPTPILRPGDGWIPAGPSDAQHIVFAPRDPATAYTCGAPALSSFDQSVPMVVWVSGDTGHTWRPMKTPARGVECDLTVNPSKAQDLILGTISPSSQTPSPAGTTPSSLAFYRSLDGGMTWHAWPLPPDSQGKATGFGSYEWAWVGETFFVAPFASGDAGSTQLAASVQQQPFTWVQQHGLFTSSPPNARIDSLISTGHSLFVQLAGADCISECFRVMQTADGGASWSTYTPTYQGHDVYLVPSLFDFPLFGQVVDAATGSAEPTKTYVQSDDSGNGWFLLKSFPPNLVARRIAQLPDATFYAELDHVSGASAAQPGIYRLAPGDTQWSFVAPYPGNNGSITIARDEQSHALALWGGLTSPGPNHTQAGLEDHTP